MADLRLHLRLVVGHRHPVAVLSELPHNSCFASQFSLAISLSLSPRLVPYCCHHCLRCLLAELGIASGRDRTQGGNAENIAQAVVIIEAEHEANLSGWQMSENTQVNLEETEIEYEVDSQEPLTPSASGASDAPSAAAASSSSTKKKNKRKRGSKSEEVFDIIAESIRDIKGAYQERTAVLVDMVSCFKHAKERAERKMKLMALLRDAPGFGVEDRMKAALSIARNNNLIDIVFQLQPEELLSLLKILI